VLDARDGERRSIARAGRQPAHAKASPPDRSSLDRDADTESDQRHPGDALEDRPTALSGQRAAERSCRRRVRDRISSETVMFVKASNPSHAVVALPPGTNDGSKLM
jgi:hypothetical protein